jgi:hypothetical protein
VRGLGRMGDQGLPRASEIMHKVLESEIGLGRRPLTTWLLSNRTRGIVKS